MKKIILALIFALMLSTGAKAQQQDGPVGQFCPVTEGYWLLCIKYGACIMPDCGSWEFEDQANTDWLYQWNNEDPNAEQFLPD